MQTENRNMQTKCIAIVVWKLLIKDDFVFITHLVPVPYLPISPSKKKEDQVIASKIVNLS